MQWFNIKEHSAGEKRLKLTLFLYKIFGEKILYVIAFFVAFFTFLFANDIRQASAKYLYIIKLHTNIKPTLLNQLRHISSYAFSLVDKMLVYMGKYDQNKIIFENETDKETLFSDIDENRGVFFICNHIGNVEILEAFLTGISNNPNCHINIFLSNKQSQIFNRFLNDIKINLPLKIYIIEELGPETGIELRENLDRGELIFIAGDRLSENNEEKYIETELFDYNIHIPAGVFKMAKFANVPIYCITAIKVHNNYKIYLRKQENTTIKELAKNYTEHLREMILINPLQFFHFCDFFYK